MDQEVQAYIDAVQDERRQLFAALRALVEELYPGVEPAMWYGLVTYQAPTYKNRVGWVSLGYATDGVTLYTNGQGHLDAFRAAYPRAKTGKGSIRFPVGQEVPADAVRQVVRSAMEEQ